MNKRLAILTLAALPLTGVAAPETYKLDPYHTYPNFVVEHWGFSLMHGRFDKSAGTFTMDLAAKTGSAELTIQSGSLTTGDNQKNGRPRARDEHLRSADFFNVAEFPTITFKSTSVAFNGEAPASIEGNMTLLGVTKPVSLTIYRFKCGSNPFTKKPRCGGNASGTINRSDFGMKLAIPSVGDEIKFDIEFEGEKG